MGRKIVLALGLLAMIAGCSATPSEQRAGTGALAGAAGGALLGQAIGGDTESTLIGAAAGAVIGTGVAAATDPNRQQQCRYRDRYGRVYTASCDGRY